MDLTALYARRAGSFDLVCELYRLCGVRLRHYRRLAVATLDLAPGARVADLGCGTGLAFGRLERAVGAAGEVDGVDRTAAMLARARRRIARRGWTNVRLVEADLAEWRPAAPLDGAISVLALGLAPDLERAVANVATALRPGGRLAVVDLRIPDRVPRPIVDFGIRINRPFGIERDLVERPLFSILRRHLREVETRRFFAGGVELFVGERR